MLQPLLDVGEELGRAFVAALLRCRDGDDGDVDGRDDLRRRDGVRVTRGVDLQGEVVSVDALFGAALKRLQDLVEENWKGKE